MSLNEIVNCPNQFASSTPFLVVQHIDWIQCRYLFVQSGGIDSYAIQPKDNTVPRYVIESFRSLSSFSSVY
jgi:hypothetical protein